MKHFVSLFDQAQNFEFFDAWESKSDDERIVRQRKMLAEYLEWASHLGFYKSRLEAVDFKKDDPLEEVPFLTAEMAKEHLPPVNEDLVHPGQRGYSIFQSGGTTGYPKTVVFSASEMDALDLPNGRGYYACGLKPEDRVANLFAGGSLYMTFIHINEMLERYGCINFPFAHTADFNLFAQSIEKFNINVATGVGSTIFNLMAKLKEQGYTYQFEKIFYGGEHVFEEDKKKIADVYGTQEIRSLGYGTVDTWYIGYQCNQADSGVFHLHDDQVYAEIIDEVSGKVLPPGEVGHLLVTSFPRRATPIIRYRVGDKAMMLKEKCCCGRQTPLFKLFGRGDDSFRVGFDTLDYLELKNILSVFAGDIVNFQMEKRKFDVKDQLVLNIETAKEGQSSELAERIIGQVLKNRTTLAKNLKEGSVHRPIVEFYLPGEIPLNPRTGKFIKVKDLDK